MSFPVWIPALQSERPRTPTEYAQFAMRHRGYVVIGVPTGLVKIGSSASTFAGRQLEGFHLTVTNRTTRKDWDDQRAIFQLNDARENKDAPDPAYYRCVLVAEEEC